MNNLVKPIYGMGQALLYIVLRLAWGFCKQHLVAMHAFKQIYTNAYIEEQLLLVSRAESMMSGNERVKLRNTIRTKLVEAQSAVLEDCQNLKTYIETAYDKNDWSTMIEMAGLTNYKKASGANWAAVAELITKGGRFIETNGEKLRSNLNMPVDFPDKFREHGAVFNRLSSEYSVADAVNIVDNSDKIRANNNCFTAMSVMLKDGKRVFAKDAEIRRMFTLVYLKRIGGKGGSSAIKGTVLNAMGLPLAGVEVSVSVPGSKTVITDAKGKFALKQLAEGDIVVSFAKVGLVKQDLPITLKKGITSTLKVTMQALADEPVMEDVVAAA